MKSGELLNEDKAMDYESWEVGNKAPAMWQDVGFVGFSLSDFVPYSYSLQIFFPTAENKILSNFVVFGNMKVSLNKRSEYQSVRIPVLFHWRWENQNNSCFDIL
ncbi:hypothetical protein V6N13_084269 [Hibiscus sabdariffa]